MRSPLSRAAGALLFAAVFALGPEARATWSIVVVDPATGEVGVAGATCVNNIDLEKFLPAIRVGKGAGVTQALINNSASNKIIIFAELEKGTPPAQILQMIQASDPNVQTRQIGIADMTGAAVTFTGTSTSQWAGGVTGQVGSITYAIQGNILTGAPVVQMAEQALVQTQGDLADRLMAAMLAARSMGGDGRCSCSKTAPTSCGSPPPQFTKSAHVGFMILTRIGDTDGVCTAQTGCATGSYYMNLNVKGNQFKERDPVLQLLEQFKDWRTFWTGRPDHIKTDVFVSNKVLPADGQSQGTITINPRDWTGAALGKPGLVVQASLEPGGAGAVQLGAPVHIGQGVYQVPYTATSVQGADTVRITVDDGKGAVTLFPLVKLVTADPVFLTSTVTSISTALGDDIPLALNGGPGLAGHDYVVLISLSGTQPPTSFGNVTIPLANDPVVGWSFAFCNSSVLQNTCGTLDAQGAAQAKVVLNPGDLAPIVGQTLTFAAVTLNPVDYASAPVAVAVAP